MLDLADYSDLRFGRVIAVAAVYGPTFDWSSHIRNGRIEAVLDQCGESDRAVPFTQFTIPGTGPGGRHGFMDPAVINVRNSEYGHSTAFTEAELARNLAHGGLWDQFLRDPLPTFSDQGDFYRGRGHLQTGLYAGSCTHVSILMLGAVTLVVSGFIILCVFGRH